MIQTQVNHELYYLVPALDSAQLPSNTNTCEGCCFEEEGRCEQPTGPYIPEPTVQCSGHLIFIEGTPEAVAAYVNKRMDYATDNC